MERITDMALELLSTSPAWEDPKWVAAFKAGGSLILPGIPRKFGRVCQLGIQYQGTVTDHHVTGG